MAVENMVALTAGLLELMDEEVVRAQKANGFFHSGHEMYAVLLEELEEAKEDMATLADYRAILWQEVRREAGHDLALSQITDKAISAAAELLQVAAVARRYEKQLAEFKN